MSSRRAGRLIIFSDLDGTLLDSDYSFSQALPALRQVRSKKVPLVLTSSKTRSEIEVIRRAMKNDAPFIGENGGGIFIPKNYFSGPLPPGREETGEEGDYTVIKLGASYPSLRTALGELRRQGLDVRGFGDMSVGEVMALTGLPAAAARNARKRDFDEPFIFRGSRTGRSRMKKLVRSMGYHLTEGEFYHIMGDSDKGKAVRILIDLYLRENRDIVTAALGDSPNDIEMLQEVIYPFVIMKASGRYHPEILRKVKNCIRAGDRGPAGWNRAVLRLLQDGKILRHDSGKVIKTGAI